MILLLRRSAALITLACAVVFAFASIHWPLVGDASLMHYVVFLAGHGQVPYKDIVDINLPGTYATTWLVMHTFGPGALAWRIYDIALGIAATGAMMIIAWPEDTLAGLLAGALFFLIHGRDGIAELGQRDLLMTILLLWAVALTLVAMRRPPARVPEVRRRRMWVPQVSILRPGISTNHEPTRKTEYALIAAAATLAGLAATVKPTAAVFWIATLLFIVPFNSRRYLPLSTRQKSTSSRPGPERAERVEGGVERPPYFSSRRLWLAALAPFLIAPAVEFFLILRSHALPEFWFTITQLDPLHNKLLRVPNRYFLAHPLPATLLPLLLLGAVVLLLRHHKHLHLFNSTETLIALNFLCGLISFIIQRKALPYHRYPADAFFILLVSMVFFHAVHQRHRSKALAFAGAAGLLFCALVLAPQSLARTLRFRATSNDFSSLLQNDLTHLASNSASNRAPLDGHIQCIDFTAGCVTTLYRMGLTQSTGFLYDCYAFQSATDPVVQKYRQRFRASLEAHPPEVIIQSDQDCDHPHSFGNIARWPELNQFVAANYVLIKQTTPPQPIRWADNPATPYSYRIYLLRR